jgi:hypothetical protein
MLGLCFARKKGFNMVELALSQFRKGLDDDSGSRADRLKLLYDMGVVLQSHGRNQEASERFQECLGLQPGYLDAQQRLDSLRP